MPSLEGRRVLVTGVTGFVGRVLAARLQERGAVVSGVASQMSPVPGVDVREIDLRTDEIDVRDVDDVVHLAGLAAVGPSFDNPQLYISANSAMMTNVSEPLLRHGNPGRLIVVSSGAVYGAGDGSPLSEAAPEVFGSPYVVSKVLVENQAAYYRGRGLRTVVVRPFNHIGPGQRPGFIVPDLAVKLKSLSRDRPLAAGNLDARRDYTDVRDVVEAYVRLLESDHLTSDLYNVASGVSRSGWDVLDELLAGLHLEKPTVETAASRAYDPSIVVGDAGRLRRETGWSPTFSFSSSIRDFLSAE